MADIPVSSIVGFVVPNLPQRVSLELVAKQVCGNDVTYSNAGSLIANASFCSDVKTLKAAPGSVKAPAMPMKL